MSTTISQTIDEAGLKKAVVTLPGEVSGNNSALLTRCSAADFDAGNCADDTIVGTGVAASPLQAQPLTGNVYLLDPSTTAFPDLGIDLKGGLALKVKGGLSIVPVSGGSRIVVTFDGLPDIPLSEFTLTFDGGPGGLNLLSRNPCEPPPLTFNADFTGQSGQSLNFDSPADATCPGSPGGKKPKAAIRIGKVKSGKPKLGLTLKAGSTELRSAKVALPKGLKVGAKRKLTRGTNASGGSVRGSRQEALGQGEGRRGRPDQGQALEGRNPRQARRQGQEAEAVQGQHPRR